MTADFQVTLGLRKVFWAIFSGMRLRDSVCGGVENGVAVEHKEESWVRGVVKPF